MTFFLQFEEHLQVAEHHRLNQKTWQSGDRLEGNHSKFIVFLEKMNVKHVQEVDKQENNKIRINFMLQMRDNLFGLCKITINKVMKVLCIQILLLENGKLLCIYSSEIIKNICRTINKMNMGLSNGLNYIAISPLNGAIAIKNESKYLFDEQEYTNSYLIKKTTQMFQLLQNLTPILLFATNLISRSSVESRLNSQLKKRLYADHSQFHKYSEIYELLPLIECKVEDQKMDEQYGEYNSANNLIQIYYQNKKKQLNELQLYIQPLLLEPVDQINNINKILSSLIFPSSKQNNQQNNYIFNTITVLDPNKNKRKLFAEGGKAKIVLCQTKFRYSQSKNPLSFYQSKNQKSNCDQSTQQGDDTDTQYNHSDNSNLQSQRVLLVKMPRVGPNDRQWRKLIEQIRYEKAILSNFRTVACGYFPRYYHTTQKNFDYSHYLMMDKISGCTLTQQMQKKQLSLTHKGKFNILSHISNAIRFLQEYQISHLDLTPSNILIVKNLFIKLIDFGQAYHKNTLSKFAVVNNKGQKMKYNYSPGRTFPYAPPETSCRVQNFTNQQDIYSLGVIMYQLIFGVLPFNYSRQLCQELYARKNYLNRFMLAPERCQYYGFTDYMVLALHLILKMMQSEEDRRPLPIWAHIIIKKIFCAIQ